LDLTVAGRARAVSGAADVRDALLDGLVPGDVPGKAWVRVGRDDVEPAWAWLGRLVAARSDWRFVAGLALAHALKAGGDAAWVALCDLFAWDRAAALLRSAIEPLLPGAPDVSGTLARNGMGGGPTPKLADVLRDQAKVIGAATDPARRVILDEWHGPFVPRLAALGSESEVRALLGETADLGRSWRTSWGAGAWGWLYEEFLFRPGLATALPSHVRAVVADDGERVFTALAWLSVRWDLRLFADVLGEWRDSGAAYLGAPRDHVPRGWRIPPLAVFGDIATCNDAIAVLLEAATHELRTVPVLDLPLA
jgi:hypothetical protein